MTRLRILNLLRAGPLCVCHLQEIIGEPQAKMSKQLKYMKKHGLLESERSYNWTIYRVTDKPPHLLEENLRCLQDCSGEQPVFRADLKKRKTLLARIARTGEGCPPAFAAVPDCDATACAEGACK